MQTWVIYALLSGVFSALVAIFGKIGISKVDTTLATTIRGIIMGVFLIIVALSLGKFQSIHTISDKSWLFIILSGIAGALSWLAYFMALKTGPAGAVVALDRLSLIYVLIFAALFLAEKLTAHSIIGAILMVIGAILLTK